MRNIYRSFMSINRNARISIAVDPLFTIPITMFMTYQSIYMNRLGLSAEEIGYITSIGLLAQLLNSFYAGVITNKFGRKLTIFVFDIISWCVAFIVWALSKSFITFLIATILNSFVRVAEVAWRCILVDDSAPDERIRIFTFQNVVFVIGGMVVPVGGLLVSKYGVITATRIILVIGFIAILIAIIIRHFYLTETSVGLEMMKRVSSKDHDPVKDIVDAIKYIVSHKENFILLIIMVLNNFQYILKSTYYNLYLTSYLKISDKMVSLFPGLSAIVTLVALYTVLPKLASEDDRKALLYGLMLISGSNLVFIFTPPRGFAVLIASVLLGAIGAAIMGPYIDTCWANSIEDDKRANVISYSTIFITVTSIPAGTVGGFIYTLNPVMLFVLIFVLTLFMSWLAFLLILRVKAKEFDVFSRK
ncbi:Major Facilitator Superfamily protein [Caldanaerobius fijiensis DSM 17918]|uniref:Major Facilitator Superfamily protein n=1 Tax=Caldanaerobius fijiensis DSM 17918 TaxID=1121256 RepID=A0A1M4SWI4_9THEO|nr:MFS transporter [Caldanaerobius fijiensis]SHE36562.1 Major Facilitator Superfamily protein [Caldanaerobius fijiensis DSM 17918]